jgi:hypothetical protein
MRRSFVSSDTWRMRSPSFLLAAGLVAFLLFLGVRGFLLPVQAAHGFGLPLLGDGDAHWLRIKAGRDLSVGLMMAALLGLRMRSALGVVLLAGGVIPLLDCIISVVNPSGHVGYALAVHGSTAVFAFALAASLLRLPRVAATQERRQPNPFVHVDALATERKAAP